MLSTLRIGRLYPPGNISSTHFYERLSQPQGHRNRTRDLPTCSAVPQPTAPLRTPYVIQYETISCIPLPFFMYSVQRMNIGVLQVAVLYVPAGLFMYTLTRPRSCTANVRGFECSNLPCNMGVRQNRVANFVWKISVT